MIRLSLLSVFLAGALGGAVAAGEKPAMERPFGTDQDAIEALMRLRHPDHVKALEVIGALPPDSYYNCLCASAGYGSPQTGQYYHPAPLPAGTSPSCEQAGEPCIVAGWGCSRHPLPKDAAVLQGCDAKFRRAGAGAPFDTALDALLGEAPEWSDAACLEGYEACRAHHGLRQDLDYASRTLDGLAYLAANKTPLIPAPPKIARGLQKDAATISGLIKKKTAADRNKADLKAFKGTLEKIFANRALYEEVARTALGNTRARIAELEAQMRQQRDIRKSFAISSSGASSRDKARALAHGRALDMEAARTRADIRALRQEEESLQTFISGARTAVSAYQLAAGLEKLIGNEMTSATDRATALVGLTKTLQGHFDDYVTGQNAALDALIDAQIDLSDPNRRILTDTGNDEAAALFDQEKKTGKLNQARLLFKTVIYAAEKGIDASKYYGKMMKVVEESERRAASGSYSTAQRNLIDGFAHMAELADVIAPSLPSGAKEMLQVYAEAMRMPDAVHRIMTKATERTGVKAEVSGAQAGSYAMKQAFERLGTLNHDPYLREIAGLAVYEDDQVSARLAGSADEITHVALPDQDGEPIYLTARQYERLQEMAYYWPIAHGKPLTDEDVAQNFGNLGKGGLPPIGDLRRLAEDRILAAARKQRIARIYGKSTVSFEEMAAWRDFQALAARHLPALCALDPKLEKALFNSWREDGDPQGLLGSAWRHFLGTPAPNDGKSGVEAFLRDYGARMTHGKTVGAR